MDEGNGIKVARGLLAGLIAGAVASFAMDRFQAGVNALTDASGGDSEPATEQAADAVARVSTGGEVPDAAKPLAGQAVHYAFGALLGAAYGVVAEFRPGVARDGGLPFGLATATLFDEAAVPAAGLGPPPWRAGWGGTLYGYASHLVFGSVLELVRGQTVATLRPRAS